MRSLLLGAIIAVLTIVVPVSTMAGVKVDINIGVPGPPPVYQSPPPVTYQGPPPPEYQGPPPPPVAYQGPPDVVALPETDDVYVIPDISVDIFFWHGWWWRPWGGRWYWSHYYNRGWVYYRTVPSFYFDVDPGWRGSYRNHMWSGYRWNYERVPYQQLQRNWKNWQKTRYWEQQKSWGIQNYRARSQQQIQEQRRQRQNQYQNRPEVQRYQKQVQKQQKQSPQHQPQQKRPQPGGQQQYDKESQHQSHQQREEGRNDEDRK